MTRLLRLVLTAIAMMASSAVAADIHVDANAGRDTNAGTADAPLKTLGAGMVKATAGDTIHLQPGAYGAIAPPVKPGKHLYTGGYVTIQPAKGVKDSRKAISIERIKLGVRSGNYSGKGRTGTFDVYLRVKGVRIVDGVYVFGGRHLEIADCRIERIGPHVGSAENIEKFAITFGPGHELVVRDSEITNTAGGVVLHGSRGKVINCDIHDITHDGIRCVSSKDSLVEGCRIYNLDDGVEDSDPRGKGWNRHCDAIHIFIPGPGVPGAQNERLTIRGNVMYNCESQAMQFNNYLRKKDLWNSDILIENNIFGPTRANVVNIADPVDGLIFRHNTYVHFPNGRTFKGLGRDIKCNNHTFRITPRCKRAQVYNNILCNTFSASPGWFVGYNVIATTRPNMVPVRFEKLVGDVGFVAREKFDGKLKADSPAIDAGTARFAKPPVHPVDFYGTKRDARPDCGAVELPGRKPIPEKPRPTFIGPATVYVEDFADGNTTVDPWLAGKGQQGLAWVGGEAGLKGWHIQPIGKRLGLSAQGVKGPAWMFTQQGEDWADVTVSLDYSNAYNTQGGGVMLRAGLNGTGYLVDLVAGKVIKRDKSDDGKIIEAVLGAVNGGVPRRDAAACSVQIKNVDGAVRLTLTATGGKPQVVTDTSGKPIQRGRVALYCSSRNGHHRTDVVGVKVTVERRLLERASKTITPAKAQRRDGSVPAPKP